MAAVAHGWKKPGGGGPPKSVAKEFNQADKGTALLQRAMAKKIRSKHKEPDTDQRGGKSDSDADDR